MIAIESSSSFCLCASCDQLTRVAAVAALRYTALWRFTQLKWTRWKQMFTSIEKKPFQQIQWMNLSIASGRWKCVVCCYSMSHLVPVQALHELTTSNRLNSFLVDLGLRQGPPLSLILFIIFMDIISMLFLHDVSVGFIRCWPPACTSMVCSRLWSGGNKNQNLQILYHDPQPEKGGSLCHGW